MALTTEQRLIKAEKRLAELEHQLRSALLNREDLDDEELIMYAAVNKALARPYPVRARVDSKRLGCKTVSRGSQPSARQISLNTNRFIDALKNRIAMEWEGELHIDGTALIDGVSIDIKGLGNGSALVQHGDMTPVHWRAGNTKAQYRIEGIEFIPRVQMESAHALRLEANAEGGYPTGYIRNVTIERTDDLAYEWAGGIWITNPNEMEMKNLTVRGNLDRRGDSWLLDSTEAAISFSIQNCKVYDAEYSLRVLSSTAPGIEGIMVMKCDAVGVKNGFWFESTAPNDVYLPPQVDLVSCHANVAGYENAKAFFFKNYAQVNAFGCSAYLGGENQTGFYMDTCSESNFVSTRVYNNGSGSMKGIYLGPNNVYCSFIGTRGALGEGNPLFHVSEGSAFTTIDTANDITNPDLILDEGVATRIENVYKGNTGRTLGERITAYERTWPFRTQDEQLYVRRYPSDDPLFPDRLTVESRQPFLSAYTTEAPAELWWKLWESLPVSNAGSRDFLHFSAQLGRWENFAAEDGSIARQQMDIVITTREGISVKWETEGNISTSGIVVFNDGGKASVWMCLKSTTHVQSGSVSVHHRVGEPMPRQLWPDGVDTDYYTAETGVSPVSAQPFSSGSIIFDSRHPETYKPTSWRKKQGLLTKVEAATDLPDTTLLPEGYYMHSIVDGVPCVFYNVGGQIKRQSAQHIFVALDGDGYDAIPDGYAGLVYWQADDVFELFYRHGGNVERLPLAPVGVTDGTAFYAGVDGGTKVPVVYTTSPRGWEYVSWETYADLLKSKRLDAAYLSKSIPTVSSFGATHKEIRFDTATGQLVRLT